jgi:hypothetical protein
MYARAATEQEQDSGQYTRLSSSCAAKAFDGVFLEMISCVSSPVNECRDVTPPSAKKDGPDNRLL